MLLRLNLHRLFLVCLTAGVLGCGGEHAVPPAPPLPAVVKTEPAAPLPVQKPSGPRVSVEGYSLPESDRILPAQEITNGYYLTPTGKMGAASPKDPYLWFLVIPKYFNVPDSAEHGKKLLSDMTSVKGVEIISQTPIEMVGLSGTETIAHSADPHSNDSLIMYQVNLHGAGIAVMLRGTVDRNDPEKFMDEFHRIAHGLTKEAASQ